MPSIEEASAVTGFQVLADNAEYFLDLGVKCTCGDAFNAFNAGFAVAYCHGFNAETTVRFAQATSALKATGLGSQAGVTSVQHTLDFMKRAPTRAEACVAA